MTFKTFNIDELKGQFQGDEEILLEMINLFFKNCEELLNPIRKSIKSKDADQLKINAHTFKGVMSNFYAEEMRQIAYELELRGEHSKLDDALEILYQLEERLILMFEELSQLQIELKNFR